MFIIFSAFLLICSIGLLGNESSVLVLFFSQLMLLVGEVRKGQVSGVGGFIFMSFLFFGMRPLHLLIESDYELWTDLFRISVDLQEWSTSMWWGTCAMLCFAMGAEMVSRIKAGTKAKLEGKGGLPHPARLQVVLATDTMVLLLVLYQIGSLILMYQLSNGGRSLYGSALGAYAYDLPIPLQSGHIFALVVILERYLSDRKSGRLGVMILSGCLLILFTWLMREVSMFRGFYIAGVMIAGIAVLSRLKEKVSLYWLMLPIVLVQPLFRTLGEQRFSSNDEIRDQGIVAQTFSAEGIIGSYWRFYDSGGDMNIFDTFVAARVSEPAFRPFVLTWLYAPVHLVPRAFWKSKPEQGILQDVAFMNGAPYCPGIAGFFQLDGGDFWMLFSMLMLGAIVSKLDRSVIAMPPGYLRSCLIAILVINAMFLSRAFLWFYVWQVIYAVVPCLVLSKILQKESKRMSNIKELRQKSLAGGRYGK